MGHGLRRGEEGGSGSWWVREGAGESGIGWNGIEWVGVVWCGMGWGWEEVSSGWRLVCDEGGASWCGVVWRSIVWRGVAWRGVV